MTGMDKIAGVLLFAVFLAVPAGAKEFSLTINDLSGLEEPWPIVGSLAFPEGELKDLSAVRVMKDGREVPLQVDAAATWRDGSIRWALAGFTAPPQGKYTVEYGEGVKRSVYPNPLRVTRLQGASFTVDTGAAVYLFDNDKLLPESGWLVTGGRRVPILEGSGGGAYLVDNKGRTARVSGEPAQVENVFIKEGPGRVVLKRSGWYVTETGEKLARAEAWLYFSAGVPYVRMTHSMIFTEDTNKTWLRDYGLEFKTPGKPSDVYCAVGENGQDIRKVANIAEEVFILQSEYPHFAEREYRAAIGISDKGKDGLIEEIKTAGDWAHGDYGSFGITLVMPWLAERYPKELSFGERGARAVLWSGRSGKELDFRAKTLVREYFQRWVTEGLGITSERELDSVNSNAQGAARTHDIWFLPHTGGYRETAVRKTALAGARPPLVMADPAWLCATGAKGKHPMRHKDTEMFPAEEKLISDYWDRIILPLKAFPMDGFIAWGCYPDRSYVEVKGKLMSAHHALSNLREYGLRREPWRLYARSGERRYYDYGHRFSRFTGDWAVAHWKVPGNPGKEKGDFTTAPGGIGRSGKLPLFWGDRSHPFMINSGNIGHWLLEYYLTGDERSLDIIYKIKESFARHKWEVRGNIMALKPLVTLSMLDWDENAMRAARETAHSYIDLASQNGIKGGGYGPMYKDHRTGYTLAEYYLETGDESVKEAILKLHDQRYRFDRRYRPTGHKNHDLFMHSLAYWITGEMRHRYVVEQILNDALYYSSVYPLSEDLKAKPENPLEWPNLYIASVFPGPRRSIQLGQHEFHNPFIGIPTALKLLAEEGRTGKRTPLVIKSMDMNHAKAFVRHDGGKDTVISFYYTTLRQGIMPQVFKYPYSEGAKPLEDIKVEIEQRIQWPERVLLRPDAIYHAFITLPSNTPSGFYLVSLGGNEPFTLLDTTNDFAALYCPEGFWSANGSPIRRKGEGAFGRAGEGVPMYFRVPPEVKTLRVFLGRPARIRRPDGSIAVEWSDDNIGNIEIPSEGKGGIWRLDPFIYNFSGFCPPSFFRLLNVEPIVSFGSPALLPDKEAGSPLVLPQTPPLPLSSMEFVKGIEGQAVRLSESRTLKFPRGPEISRGGYSFFPDNTGTVEFWYRADRSTHEVPVKMTQAILQSFLRASHVFIGHLLEVRTSQMDIDSNLRLEMFSSASGPSPAGYQSNHFFKAGEWVHIAFTWDVKQAGSKMEGELAIFVNGKKYPFEKSSFSIPVSLDRSKPFELWKGEKNVVIGPFEGSMDMLRISDMVRYRDNFTPSASKPSKDANTRALFLFDNSLKGSSSFSEESAEAI